MRTILARASNGKEKEQDRRFSWYRRVPFSHLLLLTRPAHLGSIRGTSEHTSKVAPTRKNEPFFIFASRFRGTRVQDARVVSALYESYKVVASQKKNIATDIENCDPQYGDGRKNDRGRLDATIESKERRRQLEMAHTILETNSILPIMSKVHHREVELFWEVLAKNKKYWRTKDEKHLEAPWITPVVDRLVAQDISLQDVSPFSHAYGYMDRVTSAVTRSQCALRCLARSSHVRHGVARDLVCRKSKTYRKQARTKKVRSYTTRRARWWRKISPCPWSSVVRS